jgi:hypothetical protein
VGVIIARITGLIALKLIYAIWFGKMKKSLKKNQLKSKKLIRLSIYIFTVGAFLALGIYFLTNLLCERGSSGDCSYGDAVRSLMYLYITASVTGVIGGIVLIIGLSQDKRK